MTEFGFGKIEPAAMLGRVMPFEAGNESPGLRCREGFIKGSRTMSVEIVLDQDDLVGMRQVAIR